VILIIDDEAQIREAVAEILEIIGVESLMAANGLAGMELFHAHRSQIRCILLDLRMPGVGGQEIFRRLREIDPNLDVILSTGFDDIEIDVTLQTDSHLYFLQKPYTVDTLLTRIQSILQ
jgi:FixJ family two-component response regulator